jgi:PilZ domain
MERRSAPRKPVLMSGVIKFAETTLNCLICDMSISGAAIEVSNPQDIPERFSVLFKGDDTPLTCYVVWHKADRVGVAFEL